MALRQFTLTMTGSAVQAVPPTDPGGIAHMGCKYVRIESDASNAIVQYGTSAVTATSYAGTVLANTATINNAVIIGPFDTLAFNLEELWFIGTNTQKIRLTVIT